MGKILDVQQGSEEWLQARMGIATASELDSLVTPLWKIKEGAAFDSYVAFKLAEAWLGHPIQTFSGGMMDQGKVREDEAIPAYEFLFKTTIKRVGFIISDDGLVGGSPDGIFEEQVAFINEDSGKPPVDLVPGVGQIKIESGIEVKCPEPQKHVAYLLVGECPKEYRHQVQASMYVTGAKWWTFMSYCRDFPIFTVVVERDEKAMAAIAEAAKLFRDRFDAGWAELVKSNGGEPVRPKAKAPEDSNWHNPDGITFEEVLEMPNAT